MFIDILTMTTFYDENDKTGDNETSIMEVIVFFVLQSYNSDTLILFYYFRMW